MTLALARPSPFSADFAALDLTMNPLTQDGAMPRMAQQKPIGIVVTGDNHLSAPLPRLSPQRRADRRQRLRNGFAAAASHAIQQHARLFLHVGDLFDTPTPSNEDRAFVAGELARLREAEILCAAIGGNHDTPRMSTEQGGESPLQVYARLGGLHYFAAQDALEPLVLTLDDLRLALLGLSNNPVSPPGSDPLTGVPLRDPEGQLERADVALLMLHAGIEGLCQPNEGERIVARASLAALPPLVKVVVAGHIHRYASEKVDGRGVVVTGATERMEFGAAHNSSGFAWLEVDRGGLRRAEHVRVQEQPRADMLIPTSRMWPVPPLPRRLVSADATVPGGADIALDDPIYGLRAHGDSGGRQADPFASPVDPAARHWQGRVPDGDALAPLAVIRAALAEVCTPETMVRLRLHGPLTRDHYHQLAFRDILLYGQQHAFSFDLDTSGLTLLETETTRARAAEQSGPLSPVSEMERLLAEWLDRATEPATQADHRAAAELVLGKLRVETEREGGS